MRWTLGRRRHGRVGCAPEEGWWWRVGPGGGRPDGGVAAGARGQSTVELALVLPFVALAALGVVQVGVLVHDQVLLTHAAREAARAAAVSDDGAAPRRAAEAGGGLRGERLTVRVEGRGPPGSYLDATLNYQDVTEVPLIGALLPDLTLQAHASMRVEG
jgi:hypothetical protein